MNVLVSGAAGMIGRAICAECLSRGWRVTGVDNLRSGRVDYIPAGVHYVNLDICHCRSLDDRYDAAWHCAAEPFIPDSFSRPADFVLTNVLGTLRLLEALRPAKRILVVSSSEIYGNVSHSRPIQEWFPGNPASTYGVTKLAAEQLARMRFLEHGQPIIVFRPFNVYGTHCCQPYVITEVMRQLAHGTGTVQLGNIQAIRDFTWVTDMAWALVETALKGRIGETYHWGSGEARSIQSIALDLVSTCPDAAKRQAYRIQPNDFARMRPNDVQFLQADRSKLESVIGPIRPETPWSDGLERMWAWYQEIGYKWPWENQT